MDDGELATLSAWADGRAGASPRLAVRAWAILKREQRIPPLQLNQALGGATRAAQWFSAFDTMGLAGLIDAPRSGRPANALAAMTDRLALARGPAGHAVLEAAREAPRSQREALWRLNRKSGASLERRHGLDLGIAAPPDWFNLGGLFLGRGLCVMGFMQRPDDTWSGTAGRWLGVRRTEIRCLVGHSRRPTLWSAIDARLVEEFDTSRSDSAAETKSLRRFVGEMAAVANGSPGRLTVEVIVDLDSRDSLIEWLRQCRRLALWRPVSGRFPTALGDHRICAAGPAMAPAIRHALDRQVPRLAAGARAKIATTLAAQLATPFAWIRAETSDEAEAVSDGHPTGEEDDTDD